MSTFTVNTAVEQGFKRLGFSEKESLVYLCLGDTGKATAHVLAKRCGLARTTVYFILENLVTKGVVTQERKKGTTFYIAHKPSVLPRLVEREKEEIKHKETLSRELERLVAPLFKSRLYQVPTIQFFEGKDNVLNMLYEYTDQWWKSVAEYGEPFWGYQDHEVLEEYREWVRHYWQMKKPDQRIRVFSNKYGWEEGARVPNRELKLIGGEQYFQSNIWIAGEYVIVIMHRHKPQYAFQIRDRVLASNLVIIFELLWNLLPQMSKQIKS